MSSESGLPHTAPPVSQEARRVQAAFVAAPLVSITLFVTFSLLLGFNCFEKWCITEMRQIPVFFLFVLFGLAFAVIPMLLATVFLAYPVYWALVKTGRLNTVSIVTGSLLVGCAAAYLAGVWFRSTQSYTDPEMTAADFFTFVLPAGVCALIGGLVFCWMTIWRKPKERGAADGP